MKLLTVQEAAETLRVTPQWVYKMARRGRLPTVRLGRQIRIDAAVLDGWLAERSSNGNGQTALAPSPGDGARDASSTPAGEARREARTTEVAT